MKIDSRKIFIISVLAVCVIAINLAVYFAITEKPEEDANEIIVDTQGLTENFYNIFDNSLNLQSNKVNISKENNEKDIIYTSYTNKENLEKKYKLDVNIPYLNINNENAKSINQEINSLFYKKAQNIISNGGAYTVYSVNYKAYVNDNILSLVINASLKEGEKAQRAIIKTYNYNISSGSILNIKDILQYRKITEEYAQANINEIIQKANEEAKKYQELGYNKLVRNTNDNMYKLNNTKVFFLGENKAIYIIYPYGNSSYTSELDLLVI